MVRTEFDQPDDLLNYPCKLCGVPLKRVEHHWVMDRWLHATVHDRCADAWSKNQEAGKPKAVNEIPEKFRTYDFQMGDQHAVGLCAAFSPESKVKTLLISGLPARGKSRLLWATIKDFFDQLGHSWVEAFVFETLVSEFDKVALLRVTQAKYVLVDDIGTVESYGRERAGLQAAIRSRIKRGGCWTFMTVDNFSFDPELENICKGRALHITV